MCGCRAGLESNLHSTVSAGPLLIQSYRQTDSTEESVQGKCRQTKSLMQRQKALGIRGRLLQRGPVLYLASTMLLLRYYPVNSPLMQHLCLRGFQACCFGEHAVVNMAVCGRTYERTSASSSGDGDILSVYQGELRGDCLSIS